MHAGRDDHRGPPRRPSRLELDAGHAAAARRGPRATRARRSSPPARSTASAQRGDEPARVDRVVAVDVEREPHRRARARARRGGPGSGAGARRRGRATRGTRSGARARRPRRRRARRPACPTCGGRDRGRTRRRARRRSPRTRRRCAARARAARARRTRPRRPARASRRRRATRPARRRRARRCAARAAPRATRTRGRSARRRHGDVIRLRCCHWHPSLRRHDPDQVRRSAARCRPLSPLAGSRCGAFSAGWYLQTGRRPARPDRERAGCTWSATRARARSWRRRCAVAST